MQTAPLPDFCTSYKLGVFTCLARLYVSDPIAPDRPSSFRVARWGKIWGRNGIRGIWYPKTTAMKWIYIALSIYLLLGVLSYWGSSGSTGIELVGGKKASTFRRICIVLFWPLAMVGAIEA